MDSPQPIQVLLVEHSPADARRVIEMLRGVSDRRFRSRRARRFYDIQRHLESNGTDIMMLDLGPTGTGGLKSVVEAQRIAPSVPLVVLSEDADAELADEALQQGAQDFLVKHELTSAHLSRALLYAIARHHWHTSWRTLSLVEDLTGLNNRRGFITLAEQQLKLTARRKLRSSLVFVDLDRLKEINDTYGHREGDRALQQVARMFRECFRESDIVARLGGDEFCALLTDASESSKELIRRRLGRALAASNLRAHAAYHLSVSMGIVEVDSVHGIEHEIARADASMYEEKRTKRSRSVRLPSPGDHALV